MRHEGIVNGFVSADNRTKAEKRSRESDLHVIINTRKVRIQRHFPVGKPHIIPVQALNTWVAPQGRPG